MSPDAFGLTTGELEALTAATRRAFSETSDPAAYVARPATEATLGEVGAWLAESGGTAALGAIIASPGFGKTLLLRVVEARLNAEGLASVTVAARPKALYLPYAGLGPTDLAIWVHGLLGRACPALEGDGDAIAALGRLGDGVDAPFTLLLDDADSMPAETIEALVTGMEGGAAPIRLLLALNPDSKGSRLLAALHALSPREFRYRDRLSPEETGAYVRARMRWAGFPDAIVDRVDHDEAQRIHALSNGVPRAIHAIASELVETAAAIGGAEALGAKRAREEWMGRPIEDDLDL